MMVTANTLSLLPPAQFTSGKGIFVSVHLNTNRPVQIVRFLEAIERTAEKPARVEVIVHIDTGDSAMEKVLAEQKSKLSLTLRWLATDLIHNFADTWKPYNLILPMTDPNAYFITLLSDEMLFEEPGWDRTLAQYVGYFPDHIFRLRGSRYRFRNYTDAWECGFAPDSIAFYTRDWLMIQGGWNPCNGPDSFQQCVSYYLYTSDSFSHTQYCRDIQLHFMRFSGEGASTGMDEENRKKRITLSTRMWFILMSHRYQQEAKRRAMLLKAHIVARARGQALRLEDDGEKRRLALLRGEEVVATFTYRLPGMMITLRNLRRAPWYHYYGGGGHEILRTHPWLGVRWILDAYCPSLMRLLARKR
jgi:hypothetical protein